MRAMSILAISGKNQYRLKKISLDNVNQLQYKSQTKGHSLPFSPRCCTQSVSYFVRELYWLWSQIQV